MRSWELLFLRPVDNQVLADEVSSECKEKLPRGGGRMLEQLIIEIRKEPRGEAHRVDEIGFALSEGEEEAFGTT
jgi:hypothetical protein